jgi:hypothetical protein
MTDRTCGGCKYFKIGYPYYRPGGPRDAGVCIADGPGQVAFCDHHDTACRDWQPIDGGGDRG